MDVFKADLAAYLRGDFPECPVGPAQNSEVKVKTAAGAPTGK